MANSGPSITIEEFEAKYPISIKEKFDTICKLMSSGDKDTSRRLFNELQPDEAELFKQYPNDAKAYNSLQRLRVAQLDQQIHQIDHRLAVMKEEKKEVLSQYNHDTGQSMRQFQADNSHHVESKKKNGKKHGCTVQ